MIREVAEPIIRGELDRETLAQIINHFEFQDYLYTLHRYSYNSFMTVHHSTDASFATDIATGITLVDFWATWCGPCQIMIPRLDELAAKVGDTAKIMKMDVDANPDTPGSFNIMSIPTIIIFKDGKIVEKMVGTKEVIELEAMITKHA